MVEMIEKKRLAILKILKDAGTPVSSRDITERLSGLGYDISERTVRFHLKALDEDGLTRYIGRHGRHITDYGIMELSKSRVFDKVGFLTAKIDQMTYRMTFDLNSLSGTVVVNVSLIKRSDVDAAFPLMMRVFESGYGMGHMLTLFAGGETVGDIMIPHGYVGVGTVCSITVNGVLLAHGIPSKSRFGGLLELEDHKPTRFVSIINYDGTSLDPLEIFIKSRMTDYLGATSNGSGLIGASFRDLPAVSRDRVIEIADRLEKIGLRGFMEVGWAGQSLREIPVNEGMVGAIVIGGLNPVAILEESGFDVNSKALSGLVDYQRLFPYTELPERATQL